jgi:hypothetical protein
MEEFRILYRHYQRAQSSGAIPIDLSFRDFIAQVKSQDEEYQRSWKERLGERRGGIVSLRV